MIIPTFFLIGIMSVAAIGVIKKENKVDWKAVTERAAVETDKALGVDKYLSELDKVKKATAYKEYQHPYREDTMVEYGTVCDPLFDHYQYLSARSEAYEAARFYWTWESGGVAWGAKSYMGRAAYYNYLSNKYEEKAMDLMFQYTACRLELKDDDLPFN